MDNQDTRAAWTYHNGTKHPDGRLFDAAQPTAPRATCRYRSPE